MNISGNHIKCDEELGEKVKQSTDTEELMSKFTSIITATCDAAFKVSRAKVKAHIGIYGNELADQLAKAAT